VRRALLSVVIGLAGAACVTASGWAIQAGALPPPTPAARVAADASVWLHEYRLVVDVFHVDHRRFKGACLRGWFRTPHHGKKRGSLLALRSVLRHRRLVRLLASAGCSGKLAPRLAGAAQSGSDIDASRGYAANQPAIELKLPPVRDERLTLYVSPRTYRPLVAIVAHHGLEATARLFLNRARPTLLARFHLPRDVARRARG
jgi:hypothetical protein